MQFADQYNNDPLAQLFVTRMRLTPVRFAILTVLIALISSTFVAYITDTLATLSSWSSGVWLLIFTPSLSGYYLWVTTSMEKIVRYLRDSEVVDIVDGEVSSLFDHYLHPWRIYLSVVGALTVGAVYFVTRTELQSWASYGLLPKLTSTVGITIGSYMASMIGLTLLLNMWCLRELLHHKDFQPNPLHPDRAGGLGILSKYSLKTAYLAAVAGMVIGFTEYRIITQGVAIQIWFVHLCIPLYLVWTVLCFFGPLLSARSEMKQWKERKLKAIADEFLVENTNVQNNLGAYTDPTEQGFDKVKTLKEYYDIVDTFPTWPFSTGTLSRFILIGLAPLIPALFGIVEKIITERLIP